MLLTGVSGGIGFVLLKRFLEQGALVAGTYRTFTEQLQGLFDEYTNFFVALHCDLENSEMLLTLPKQVESALKGIPDVLIHNAWACPAEHAYSLDNLHVTFKVGLEAAFVLYTQLGARMANAGKGSIISIASINGIQAFPDNPAYTATKAALRLFTKCIARDFGECGVRANNLCPGYVRTRMTEASFSSPERYEARRSRTMLGRWATPEDMVGPCIFLASDASRYVTATDLIVDGGWTAKGL